MPTKPFEPLLYRELSKVGASDVIGIASPLLTELVNYATNVFQRCQTSAHGAPDEHLPLLASYLHIIEMTDGIDVLVSESCPIPAIPLLRSSFEAGLTIDYILQSEYQQRAFSWLVVYVHNRLDQYQTLNVTAQTGKEFLDDLEKDWAGQYMKLPPMDDLPAIIENLQSLLEDPNYVTVEAEYQRLKGTRKRKPDWYSLYGGPANLRDLSRRLARGAQYAILYRSWSQITHAGDISRYLTRSATGGAAFLPLRNNKEIGTVAQHATSFILDATMKMLRKFRPGESSNLKKWYMGEIRQRYLKLTQ